MVDVNTYWLLLKENFYNLRYAVDNFEPIKLHVRGTVENLEKFEEINENLEGKIFDFEKKNSGYLFKLDNKEVFFFEGLRQKGFDVRYNVNNISKLVTADYEKNEYLEIWFKGKIDVESTDIERAPGLSFYRIKKS